MSFAIIPVSLDSKLFNKTYSETVVSTICIKLAEAYNLDHKDVRHKFDEIVSQVLEGELVKTVKKAKETTSNKVTEKVKCKGVTKKGDPCKKYAVNDGDFCSSHADAALNAKDSEESSDEKVQEKVKCKGVTKKGDPCKKLCTPQEEYCAQHKDTSEQTTKKPEENKVSNKALPKHIDLEKEEKVPFSNEEYWFPMKVMTLAGKRHKLHERTGFLFKEEDGEFILIGRRKEGGVYFVNPNELQNRLSQKEIEWAIECEIHVI